MNEKQRYMKNVKGRIQYKKPCFGGVSLYQCLCVDNKETCLHMGHGGTWEDCISGAKSNHYWDYLHFFNWR